MTTPLMLTGLDGANPLAFMAALGTLRVLNDAGVTDARLAWRDEGRWRPILMGVDSVEAVVDVVLCDQASFKNDEVLELSYSKPGSSSRSAGRVFDLKPPPEVYQQFLNKAVHACAEGRTRTSAFALAFAAELVQDNNGNTKPTALHFTAGQQQFLTMVRELASEVTRDHIREALVGPWKGKSTLPSLSWDATVARDYALRATDPSSEKRGSVPGADWLAFRSLPFFSVCASSRLEAQTACCAGGWKTGRFTWPMWVVPATERTIYGLLHDAELATSRPRWRRERGVGVVFECSILRSEQGGYGSFSPARPV